MKKYIAIFISALFVCTACSDFLDQGPKSSMTDKQMFSKPENTDSYIKGLYKQWRDTHRERAGIYLGVDEMALGGVQARDNATSRALDTYSAALSATNDIVLTQWTQRYKVAAGAASVIQVLEVTEESNDSISNSLLAEACFLRAVNFFELVQVWGPVPLADFNNQDQYGNRRQPIDVVYALIEKDLKTAIRYLPDPSDPNYTDKSRATKCIAQALLGKLYLYADSASPYRDYEKAAEQFKAVYENPFYGGTGASNYENIFDAYLEEGVDQQREFIYAFRFSNKKGDNNECQWYMGSRPVAIMSAVEATIYWAGFDKLLPSVYCYSLKEDGGIWEKGDLRKEISIRTEFDDDRTGLKAQIIGYCYGDELNPHCKKYEDPRIEELGLNTIYSGKPVPFIRFSDVALCYAECLYKTGSQSEAINIVNNVVRKRAFGGRLTSANRWSLSMDEETFMTNLMDERMRELCFEGWRKMDLIRTGKLKEYVEKRNNWVIKDGTSIEDYHKYWPIPLDEINKNTDLSLDDQNSGYSNK